MVRVTCLVDKVSHVSGRHKKTLEKQALVAGTKQRRQVVEADRLQGCKAGKAVRPACLVLCSLLAPLFFEMDVLQTNMC
jgi:hypothetical protein